MRITNLLATYGLTLVRTEDRVHGHYLCRGNSGRLYLVIKTNRILRCPKATGVNIDGPALGIKKFYVEYRLIHIDYVMWLLGSEARIAAAREVRNYILPRLDEVCVKRGFEVICHYPLSLTKTVRVSSGLMKFMNIGGAK